MDFTLSHIRSYSRRYSIGFFTFFLCAGAPTHADDSGTPNCVDFALDDDLGFATCPTTLDSRLGGEIFLDVNGDGLRNTGDVIERGFEKARVLLKDTAGNTIDEAYTDASGFYLFDNVGYGQYQVEFTLPQGCRYSPPNAGDDAIDSDADEITGLSHTIEFTPGNTMDFTVGAGHVCDSDRRTIATHAADDRAQGFVGETIMVNTIANDFLSDRLTSLSIVSNDVPGDVEVIANHLTIRNTSAEGNYTVQYRVKCEDGSTDEGTLFLTLDPAGAESGEEMVANDDSVVGVEGGYVEVDILENDSLPSSGNYQVRLYNIEMQNGILNYDQDTGILSVDNVQITEKPYIRYQLLDMDTGKSDTATVSFAIDPLPSSASDDAISGVVNESMSVPVLNNDDPAFGSVSSVKVVSFSPELGEEPTFDNDNRLQIPNPTIVGNYGVVYQLTAVNGTNATARVTVEVEPSPLKHCPMLLEDYSDTNNPGWSQFVRMDSNDGNPFLGRFGTGDTIERTFTLDDPDNIESITFAFDFLEIDRWEDEQLFVTVNGERINLGHYHFDSGDTAGKVDRPITRGNQGNVSWTISDDQNQPAINGFRDGIGGNTWSDEGHRVAITLNNPEETITLAFSSSLEGAITNESWGMDNLAVTANVPPDADCPSISSAPFSIAEDDFIDVVIGETAVSYVRRNDATSGGVQSVRLLSHNIPGATVFIYRKNVAIQTPTRAGQYQAEYEITARDGTVGRATVHVNVKPDPRLASSRLLGCVVPLFHGQNTFAWVLESEAAMLNAATYRLFNQSGDLMSEQTTQSSGVAWITYQHVRKPHNFAILNTHPHGHVYYVSRVYNEIETERVSCSFNYHTSPIALDIDGSGRIERSKTDVTFDFNHDGERQHTPIWFGSNDGILVDTRIHGELTGKHLFGDMGGRYANGFVKLAEWDRNGDGILEGAELMFLGIWVDANSNARLDADELSTLADHGIVRLNTHHQALMSTAETAEGGSVLMEDVLFPSAGRPHHRPRSFH